MFLAFAGLLLTATPVLVGAAAADGGTEQEHANYTERYWLAASRDGQEAALAAEESGD